MSKENIYKFCNDCGYRVYIKDRRPGSGWIEFVLWMAWIGPGLIYSIWRRSESHKPECPNCTSKRLIPITSPKANSDAPLWRPEPEEDAGVHWSMWLILAGVAVIALSSMIPS